jgi:3-hydroxy-9,10-secoandrosta-1,3,5(10)-triene-9,17-dione monooxygenase reductase component
VSEASADASPIASEHYRATLGHFCSGVTVVTSRLDGVPVGFTCQAFSALSLDPPLVLICPGKSSSSWPKIEASGHFCINVLGEGQEELGRVFATSGADKFEGIGWTPGSATGAPKLADVLAWIECRIDSVQDGGDHSIVIGRVLEMGFQAGAPLLFFRGGYGRFAV